MEFTPIYCVQYTVVDLFDGDKHTKFVRFGDRSNALRYAALVSQCNDIDGNVDVTDEFTGEVLATYKDGKEIYLTDLEF